MVFIASCHDTVSAALPLLPLTFLDVPIVLDHASLPMWSVLYPEAILPVAVGPEHRAFALSYPVVPIACLQTPQLIPCIHLQRALSMLQVVFLVTLLLVAILIELHSKPIPLVVSPLPHLFPCFLEFLASHFSFFIRLLFLY